MQSDILAVESSDLSRILLSYKYRTAGKFGIPVVSSTYIDACQAAGTLFPTRDYLLETAAKSENFKSGKINGENIFFFFFFLFMFSFSSANIYMAADTVIWTSTSSS